jgi:hypothetical protein
MNEFVESGEQNMVYTCYNPILTICLCCEFLMKIGEAIGYFKHEGEILSLRLQDLGNKLIDGIEIKYVNDIFMDTDFLDRTVLKIITDYEYEPLLRDDKISALLDELWVGKDTYECDGRVTDFSKLFFMATSKIKNIEGKKLEYDDILMNNFKVFVVDENFDFQYKFRRSSIGFIFKKELFSTFLITVLMVLINLQYLSLFHQSNFIPFELNIQAMEKLSLDSNYWVGIKNKTQVPIQINLTDNFNTTLDNLNKFPELIEYEDMSRNKTVEQNLKIYLQWNLMGNIFSGAMIFYVFTKIVFNTFANI